jgi:ABC-2 type transport system permease protein
VADPVLSLRQSYAILIGSRVQAQLAYRSSFVVNALTAFAVGVLEFTELYVLLATVPTLGGLTLIQVALVFALANTAFSLADLIFGQLDQISRYLREGKLEAFLVRPLPLMAQLVTADFQLRRAGRMVFALLVGAVVLIQADLVLDVRTVYLLIITPFVGAAIYGALFPLAGGLQFWLVDGAEFTNAFVYGGAYAGQIPGSTLLLPIRVLFTFVIPATIVAYLPAMLILQLPGPALLPSWLGWLAPLFAVWIWLLSLLVWRAGIRRFTGAGG